MKLRIVSNSPTAQGTKVYTEDGYELKGITRIELEATAGDLWRCKLHMLASSADLQTLLSHVEPVGLQNEDGGGGFGLK